MGSEEVEVSELEAKALLASLLGKKLPDEWQHSLTEMLYLHDWNLKVLLVPAFRQLSGLEPWGVDAIKAKRLIDEVESLEYSDD